MFICQGHDSNSINRIVVLAFLGTIIMFLLMFIGLILFCNILESFWLITKLGENKQGPDDLGSTLVSATY